MGKPASHTSTMRVYFAAPLFSAAERDWNASARGRTSGSRARGLPAAGAGAGQGRCGHLRGRRRRHRLGRRPRRDHGRPRSRLRHVAGRSATRIGRSRSCSSGPTCGSTGIEEVHDPGNRRRTEGALIYQHLNRHVRLWVRGDPIPLVPPSVDQVEDGALKAWRTRRPEHKFMGSRPCA